MNSFLFASLILASQSTTSIYVDASRPTVEVPKSLYGIFFEEINQAGEGGIYPELLRNGALVDQSEAGTHFGWRSEGDGRLSRAADVVLNASRPYSLLVERTDEARPFSAYNEGFWGVPVNRGSRYRLQIWSRGEVPLRVSIGNAQKTYAEGEIPSSQDWKKHEVVLRSTGTDSNARLSISPTKAGKTWIGFASLKPLDTANGLRKDLAGLIKGMRPGFVRFPGGCFIEGHDLAQAWNWKSSLGPLELRKGMSRSFWGYPISNGMGFHEYLQWCEDLGAEALFVANCGMSHTQVVPTDQMAQYVQDILDAIEYANGPTSSPWGSVRAKNGHPKAFDLRYIQVGNENGGPVYNERYALIAKAINERYPDVRVIANVWGGVPSSYKLDIIDEHYYMTPRWFWANSNRYDRYDRSGPKIYVGEYAVTQGSGRGNLDGALSEAAFMTGMERNADIVKMATYAPLFENVNNRQWNPNAINFDNTRSFGTPSYWVQALFGQHRPDVVVEHRVRAPMPAPEPVGGGIGLMTWRTEAEFKDIQVTVDGRKLEAPLALDRSSGNWTVQDGVVRQSVIQDNRRTILKGVDTEGAKNVTMNLRARKIRGDEGFIILFETSPRRTIQWNLGGWNNTVHAFQLNDARFGRGVAGSIDANRWYDIRIEQDEKTVRGYLDGKLIEEARIEPAPDFAAVAGLDRGKRQLVLKVVNGAGTARNVRLELEGVERDARAEVTTLKGNSLADENSFEAPRRVAPRTSVVVLNSEGSYVFAPYSLTIIRVPLSR